MIRPSGLLFRRSSIRPVSQRTGPVGCWIMAQESLGPMPETPLFWHMSTYHAPWAGGAEGGVGSRQGAGSVGAFEGEP
jgi:hypothetical protein